MHVMCLTDFAKIQSIMGSASKIQLSYGRAFADPLDSQINPQAENQFLKNGFLYLGLLGI
jgi:hypothetical protein